MERLLTASPPSLTTTLTDAWYDPVAGISAYSSCIRLADLNGDGDYKLLIADHQRKLKIYKGTTLLSENILRLELTGAPAARRRPRRLCTPPRPGWQASWRSGTSRRRATA